MAIRPGTPQGKHGAAMSGKSGVAHRAQASRLKVYLDNILASGKVRGDLDPPAEMNALRTIAKAHDEGKIEVCTSRWAWAEQERATKEAVRTTLRESRGETDVVPDDHKLLGFNNLMDHLGTVSTTPIITDIVDEPLLLDLKKAGLDDGDARHLMYAIHNKCDRFLTLDFDFLDRRSQLGPLCRGTTIAKPSELIAEL